MKFNDLFKKKGVDQVAAGAATPAAAAATAEAAPKLPPLEHKHRMLYVSYFVAHVLQIVIVLGLALGSAISNAVFLGSLPSAWPRQPLTGTSNPQAEIIALWVMMALTCLLGFAFAGVLVYVAVWPVWRKFSRHDHFEKPRHHRHLRLLWVKLAGLILVGWITVLLNSLLASTLIYQGYMCNNLTGEEEALYWLSSDTGGCQQSTLSKNVQISSIFALLTVLVNTYIAFLLQPLTFAGKLVNVIPAAFLTVVLVIKSISSLEVFSLTRRQNTLDGNFAWTAIQIVCLLSFLLSILAGVFVSELLYRYKVSPFICKRILRVCGVDLPLYPDQAPKPAGTNDIEGGRDTRQTDQGKKRSGITAIFGTDEKRYEHLRTQARRMLLQLYQYCQWPTIIGFLAPAFVIGLLVRTNYWVIVDLTLGCLGVLFYTFLWFYVSNILNSHLAAMESAYEQTVKLEKAQKANKKPLFGGPTTVAPPSKPKP